MTPEEHDKKMAMIQGLSHFIAKALKEIDITSSEINTLSYDYLYKMKEIIENDSDALFDTIEIENPYAKEYREKFIAKLIEINEELN